MGASDGGEKRAPPDRRCLFDSAANRTETSFCGVCSRSIKASFFGEQLALVAVPPRRGRDSPLLKTFVRFPRFSFAALFCTAEQASREAPPARPRNAPARRRLATRPAGLSQLARSHRARVSPRPRLRSRSRSRSTAWHTKQPRLVPSSGSSCFRSTKPSSAKGRRVRPRARRTGSTASQAVRERPSREAAAISPALTARGL